MLSAFCNNNKTASLNTAVQEQKGFALVELFTSEGCSSCPAADKAVEELAKQYPSSVYVLAFHVDYWNRLGWTDEFSKPEYTARQSGYAGKFNLDGTYTPQVVINGLHEFVGSDKAKLQQVSATEAAKEPIGKIELAAELKDVRTIVVQYKTTETSDEQLHLALVQNEATTDVKRGENGGRKLHHINIVRDYKTVTPAAGRVQLTLPADVPANNTKIIAYLQNKAGAVTAVKSISVTGA